MIDTTKLYVGYELTIESIEGCKIDLVCKKIKGDAAVFVNKTNPKSVYLLSKLPKTEREHFDFA